MIYLIIVIITVICTLFGKQILSSLIEKIGIKVDEIPKEEAAMLIMEREVVFNWRPQIIDKPIATNVVNFDSLKTKKEKKNKYGLKTI